MHETLKRRNCIAITALVLCSEWLSWPIDQATLWAQQVANDDNSQQSSTGDQASESDWLDELAFGEPPEVMRGLPSTLAENNQNLASPQMVAWLTSMVRSSLPEKYEDDRKWGKQKEVWNGVDFDRNGLRITTHSRRKLVNNGTWTRYRIAAVEPDKYMKIEFRKLDVASDGRVHFDISIQLLLDVFGRLSQWARDVQIISLSANADAVCTLSMRGNVEFRWNPLQIPPDISIKPKVESAKVDLDYFRVRRISQVRGSLAKHLGNGLKSILDEKLEDSNAKLVDKINAQISKKADRMTFSTQAWLQSKLPLPPSN